MFGTFTSVSASEWRLCSPRGNVSANLADQEGRPRPTTRSPARPRRQPAVPSTHVSPGGDSGHATQSAPKDEQDAHHGGQRTTRQPRDDSAPTMTSAAAATRHTAPKSTAIASTVA